MTSEEITQLKKEYKLTDLDITRLETELELIRLKIEFAVVKCKSESITFYESLVKYAGLKRFTQKLSEQEYGQLEEKLNLLSKDDVSGDRKSKITSELFLNCDYTKDMCNHVKREVCFRYDIWKDGTSFLHFGNAVLPKNPLAGEELENRKTELRAIARDISENHPESKYLYSISWMWNLKVFQDLMPKKFNESLGEYEEKKQYGLGQWGQFYRHDGTLNKERIEQFKKTWQFPLKTLLGQCDIKYFLEMYS